MSNSTPKRHGICFIVSAPSGSGKSTLIQQVLRSLNNLEFMVSYTTRAPRDGERNGVDYIFIDDAEFDRLIRDDAFLEWAQVHRNRYGTPKREFERKLAAGIDVILEIDVQGARQIIGHHPEARSVFIVPASPDDLRNRLHKRGKDTAEAIELRLETAQSEITHLNEYNYLIINDNIDTAARELAAIIVANRCRLEYRKPLVTQWEEAMRAWPAKSK